QKLTMARDFPRESKLFANEILQGAPHVLPELQGTLRALVEKKAKIIKNWSKQGKIADIDPNHLFFSIWATTQHYADFDIQVQSVLNDETVDPFQSASPFLKKMFSTMLEP
ncbi:TetR family transcriptional regulator C-terminal domain-containing protein, partial [Amylibacter sp.]|nr:TetR family transcriptional regulator C-terminal domain-containing protein [Amylibacter sp.]